MAVADPEAGIVCVATLHALHALRAENTLAALAAGRRVLCDEPFGLNTDEAEAMVSAVRGDVQFMLDAMCRRCFHATRVLVERLAIGAPRRVATDFGFFPPRDPEAHASYASALPRRR